MPGGECIEKTERGDGGSTEWQSVAELAGRQDTETIFGVGFANGHQKDDHNYAKLREATLNKAVFTDVDVEDLKRYTGNFIELVGLEELNQLRQAMNVDPGKSLELAEDFFVDLLGLKARPEVVLCELGEKFDGRCTMGETKDTIKVNTNILGDPDRLLVTLAHENWHSYQHEQVREARAKVGKGEINYNPRADLYVHNRLNYIKGEDDIEGYVKQLVEAEAYNFETSFVKKMREADKFEEDQKFIREHPEIYGDENLPVIQKELARVLDGVDVRKLLDGSGTRSLGELFEMGNDVEGNAQRCMDGLAKLIGLENEVKVEFADELEHDSRGHFDYKNRRILLSRRHQQDAFTEILPKFAWAFRQQDMVKNHPEDEQAKLYKENIRHFVTKRQDVVGFGKQLIMREQTDFAETLMRILDEQATEEEMLELPFAKRMASQVLLWKNGRAPVMSKKYHVRRSR